MEYWRPVPIIGVPLDVSTDGRVRRAPFVAVSTREGAANIQRRSGCIYAPYVAANGYLTVAVKTRGKRTKYLVHRLIALAFSPGYAPGLSVNHIDGNKLNNLPANLEWMSLADNTRHEWASGLVNLRGDNMPTRKLSTVKVLEIRDARSAGESVASIAARCGVCETSIYHVLTRRRWKHVA